MNTPRLSAELPADKKLLCQNLLDEALRINERLLETLWDTGLRDDIIVSANLDSHGMINRNRQPELEANISTQQKIARQMVVVQTLLQDSRIYAQ